MTTQSVQAQSPNTVAKITGGGSSKPKHTGNAFDLFINSSMKMTDIKSNSQSQGISGSNTKDNNQKNPKLKDNYQDDQSKVTNNDNPFRQVKNQNDVSVSDDNASAVKDDAKDDKEDVVTDNQQLISQIVGMLQSVKDAAMKALNLSSDELNQLLSDQGMTLSDLLQPEKLQQLVLASKGTNDILSAITDENLADTMNQLLQSVDEIKENNNLGLTVDQIKALLEQAKNQGNEQVKEVMPQIVNEETIEDTNQQTPLANKLISDTKDEVSTKEQTSGINDLKTVTQEPKTHADLSQNQNSNQKGKDELGAKDQFQVFVDNLAKSAQSIQTDVTTGISQTAQFRDVVNQIVDSIKISISQNNAKMELQLNPENLGKVNLTVQSKNGVMTAQFVVQNEVSKQAIESQIQTLRDTLNQQGVKVEAIEVTVSANAFEQNSSQNSNNEAQSQKNSSGKKITLDEALSMTEIMEEAGNTEDVTGLTGSQINYTV